MYHSMYHEMIQHRTGSFPLAFYHVDKCFPRYHMTMHWHDEVEFIRVLQGSFRIFMNNSEYTLQEGDICMIGGGTVHGGEPTDCVYECVVFNLHALIPSNECCINSARTFLHSDSMITRNELCHDPDLKRSLDAFFECAGTFHNEPLRLLSRIYALLDSLSDSKAGITRPGEAERSIRHSEQIKPALEYIEHNYAQTITLEQLASLSGFSPKYFCRYFRSYVHRSPIDYLNYYRIERGAEFLLKGNENVAEIAVKCGFADSSAFIKQFKKCKGITPKQYQLHMNMEKSD